MENTRGGGGDGEGDGGERLRMNPRATAIDIDLEDPLSLENWTVRSSRGGGRILTTSISNSSLVDSMEKRTQRTYRYGIGLVCIGATLNWLGFAQGHGYVDPLRYLGVACVISGSFCVCMAMCRWLGRPIAVSSSPRLHPFLDDGRNSRQNGDVHVINVSVPVYTSSTISGDYNPTKPPDYETLITNEPPPYDEAIKLTTGGGRGGNNNNQDKNFICSKVLVTEQQQQQQNDCIKINNNNDGGGDKTPPPPYYYKSTTSSSTISTSTLPLLNQKQPNFSGQFNDDPCSCSYTTTTTTSSNQNNNNNGANNSIGGIWSTNINSFTTSSSNPLVVDPSMTNTTSTSSSSCSVTTSHSHPTTVIHEGGSGVVELSHEI